MAEPLKKKQKTDGEDEVPASPDLAFFQEKLLSQCLCCLSESSLQTFLFSVSRPFLDNAGQTTWSQDEILQFVSSLQLLCEVALRQSNRGQLCTRIGQVCEALTKNEHGIIDRLVELSSHTDHFVCFSTSRALSAFLLLSKGQINPLWLEHLMDNALSASNPRQMCLALDVMRKVVEYKDSDGHVLEERDGSEDPQPPSCNAEHLVDAVDVDCSEAKCVCVRVLEAKWPPLFAKFNLLVSPYRNENEATLITFLGLWEALISIKANLSVVDTKQFYAPVENLVGLLVAHPPIIPAVIWKPLLNLLNEVLCYGSTLALQDILAVEPCQLAHIVVRGVKDNHLLDRLPYREGSGSFGGGQGEGDKPMLQKMVLLVLKAVAVTIKETRCDSSDSSMGSDASGFDDDMAVIERSIKEVLRQLDSCIKALVPFHPETPVAQWIVQLFADQDDALVESMVCCLDTAVGLVYRNASTLPELRRVLSPTVTFVQFVQAVSHDPDVLLDLLVSNETCFLLYLLRILKFIRRNWTEFVGECGRELDDIMTVLIRLRLQVDRLVSKELFPYDISPILRLLEKCESLYEDGGTSTNTAL